MKIRNLKLGTKQAVAFGLILLSMAIAGVVSMISMQSIKDSIDHASEFWLPRAITISELSLYTNDLRRQQIQLTVTESEALREDLKEQIKATLDRIESARQRYEELRDSAVEAQLYSDHERELYDSFERAWEEYQDITLNWLVLLLDEGQQAASRILTDDARLRSQELREILRDLVEISIEESHESATEAELAYQQTLRLTRILIIIAIGLSIVFILGVVRWITRPIKNLAGEVCRVAAGDLDARIEETSKDEVGLLAQSFNQMTESLRKARAKTEEQEAELRRQNAELEDALKQLKEAQQQLIMKEKMASLGNLVAGVAHEINNPVGAVSSSSDNSRRAIEKLIRLLEASDFNLQGENQDVARILELLKESTDVTSMAGRRISQIVKSLKNFARLDEAEYQKVDVHQGIDTTLTLLHHELKNRIEVVKEYGDLPLVNCYPNQLNQVFMNLLINAAQAIPGEGQITIKTRAAGEFVEIAISDNGRGISETNLERIFDPGFTTKGVGVGTGLGLSISYNIVKKHDGDILVSSKVGGGSTFTIRLPVNPSPGE